MRPVIKRLSKADLVLAKGRPLGWVIAKCPFCGRKYIQQVVIDADTTHEGVLWNTKTGGEIYYYPVNSKKLLTLQQAKAKLI